MDVKPRQLLRKGERATLGAPRLHVRLLWKAPVDLDLHLYYRIKTAPRHVSRSLQERLGEAGVQAWRGLTGAARDGHVHFAQRGSLGEFPWIVLDHGAGVGDLGGYNEENLYLECLDILEHAIILANIFNKPNANFASFDGRVLLATANHEFEVPLDDPNPGSYCIIAHLDGRGRAPLLINIDRTQRYEPSLDAFLVSTLL